MQDIISYLIVGMVLTMFIDYWSYKLELEEAKFTNGERIMSVLFWPLIILMVIIEYIRRNNKNE